MMKCYFAKSESKKKNTEINPKLYIMKKTILFFILFTILPVCVMAQTVTLCFTGRDVDTNWLQLDHVDITNHTKGWSETIAWPDLTLTMLNGVGINDFVNNGVFSLHQNNPNPFNGTTHVNLSTTTLGAVTLEIADMNGHIVVKADVIPQQQGYHQFQVTLSTPGSYIMTARQNGRSSFVKMVNNGGGNKNCIDYVGVSRSLASEFETRQFTINPFDFGDQMEYLGYAIIDGQEVESIPITQMQETEDTIVLYFTEAPTLQYGQPCPGTPTLTDIDGNVYNTVQIGNQCWMKENLRTTHYANNVPIRSGNNSTSITERYPKRFAPNNDESLVPAYGYQYNWFALMPGASSSNANPSGVQGVCPDGWHVPSDAEWTQLENYVSSQSEYVCTINDSIYEDYFPDVPKIAKSLAATTGWETNDIENNCTIGNDLNANNATGFSALPAGERAGSSLGFCTYACFWTSTNQGEYHLFREIWSSQDCVGRESAYGYLGCSVRCVKD